MTYQNVSQFIEAIGLPFAYRFFPEKTAPTLPYIVYYYPQSDDFSADNTNYQRIETLNIELYTENKDFATERLVEDALNDNGIVYTRVESYISSEHMYEVLFQAEIMITD